MTANSNGRTVLVVEGRRDLTQGLREILEEEYEVLTAHSVEEAKELHTGHVSVSFIDRDMEDGDLTDLLHHILSQDFAGRLVSVSSNPESTERRPEFDDYIQKAVIREGIEQETLEHLVKQAVYEEEIHEWLTLLSKKASLETQMESSELERSSTYDELIDEIEELREQAGATRDQIPGERFDAIFREISRSTPNSG